LDARLHQRAPGAPALECRIDREHPEPGFAVALGLGHRSWTRDIRDGAEDLTGLGILRYEHRDDGGSTGDIGELLEGLVGLLHPREADVRVDRQPPDPVVLVRPGEPDDEPVPGHARPPAAMSWLASMSSASSASGSLTGSR